MAGWENGALYTPLGYVSVHQCGSCRDHNDPDHWSFETSDLRACGYANEAEAIAAAEHWLLKRARETISIVKKARLAPEGG